MCTKKETTEAAAPALFPRSEVEHVSVFVIFRASPLRRCTSYGLVGGFKSHSCLSGSTEESGLDSVACRACLPLKSLIKSFHFVGLYDCDSNLKSSSFTLLMRRKILFSRRAEMPTVTLQNSHSCSTNHLHFEGNIFGSSTNLERHTSTPLLNKNGFIINPEFKKKNKKKKLLTHILKVIRMRFWQKKQKKPHIFSRHPTVQPRTADTRPLAFSCT